MCRSCVNRSVIASTYVGGLGSGAVAALELDLATAATWVVPTEAACLLVAQRDEVAGGEDRRACLLVEVDPEAVGQQTDGCVEEKSAPEAGSRKPPETLHTREVAGSKPVDRRGDRMQPRRGRDRTSGATGGTKGGTDPDAARSAATGAGARIPRRAGRAGMVGLLSQGPPVGAALPLPPFRGRDLATPGRVPYGAIRSTPGRCWETRRGSRVSSGRWVTAACAPIRKSARIWVRSPPARR